MNETRLLGPKDDAYAVLSLGTAWLATTKEAYGEAVKAALQAAIANGSASNIAERSRNMNTEEK